MGRTRCAVRVLVVAVALGATVPACGSSSRAGGTRSSSLVPEFEQLVGKKAPDFSLLDQFDRRQRLSDYLGKVVLLTFVSSRCTTFCPLTAELLARTQDLLGKRADGMQVVAINANYRFTSVHDVLAWSRQHSMTHRWLFLTAQAATLWTVYHAYGVTPGDAHTVLVFMIDRAGEIRGVVPIAMKRGLDAEAAVLAKSVHSMEAQGV